VNVYTVIIAEKAEYLETLCGDVCKVIYRNLIKTEPDCNKLTYDIIALEKNMPGLEISVFDVNTLQVWRDTKAEYSAIQQGMSKADKVQIHVVFKNVEKVKNIVQRLMGSADSKVFVYSPGCLGVRWNRYTEYRSGDSAILIVSESIDACNYKVRRESGEEISIVEVVDQHRKDMGVREAHIRLLTKSDYRQYDWERNPLSDILPTGYSNRVGIECFNGYFHLKARIVYFIVKGNYLKKWVSKAKEFEEHGVICYFVNEYNGEIQTANAYYAHYEERKEQENERDALRREEEERAKAEELLLGGSLVKRRKQTPITGKSLSEVVAYIKECISRIPTSEQGNLAGLINLGLEHESLVGSGDKPVRWSKWPKADLNMLYSATTKYIRSLRDLKNSATSLELLALSLLEELASDLRYYIWNDDQSVMAAKYARERSQIPLYEGDYEENIEERVLKEGSIRARRV